MNEAVWLIAAASASVISMGWLALSYPTHWQQVFADSAAQPKPRRLKLAGRSCLLLSVLFCLLADHPSMAVLVWVMLLAFAAILVAQTLSRQPRWLRVICLPLFTARTN